MPPPRPDPLGAKLERLRSRIRSFGSCAVAYSGGVDSAFLALVCFQELGGRSLAVIADSPSLPRQELRQARELARRFRFPLEVVATREFESSDYLRNAPDRCYFCKAELFRRMEEFARERSLPVLLYGENASDLADERPGRIAAQERSVLSPLCEAGLSKEDIRALSRRLGLPTADKPAQPCLSSRIPHGEPVTPLKIQLVERAENAVRQLGFREFRVRVHELGKGHLARLEVAGEEWPRFGDPGVRERVGEALREAGFQHSSLDLLGLRRRSGAGAGPAR